MTKNGRYIGGFEVDSSENVQEFYNACTEMSKAKFILADAKISKILKCIISSTDLVDAVADCLNGFNFANEFSKIQVKNDLKRVHIILPNDPKKLVAVVFSILSEMDSHRLDLHSFIFDYFGGNGETLLESYDRFVAGMIIPFRDALCELVGVDFGEAEENIEADDIQQQYPLEDVDIENMRPDHSVEEVYDDSSSSYGEVVESFFEDIRVILNQIKDTVNMDSRVRADRKDELNITIDALLIAINYKNLKILNALMISLNYLLHPVRSVRFYNMELQNRLAKFYSDIY